MFHRPPKRRCVALDKALGPVAQQRLSDLILLSCLALPSPPTSIQAGVALGSAPLLLPPPVAPTATTSTAAAFAWADAVLFLHGRAAAMAAHFGQLAAAGRCGEELALRAQALLIFLAPSLPLPRTARRLTGRCLSEQAGGEARP